MKHLISGLFVVVILTACASQPVYRAASENGYGYYETKLSNERYRVSFKMRGNSMSRAKNHALHRASELTLLNGYDWFLVTDRSESEKESNDHMHLSAQKNNSVTHCGLLTCKTTTRPSYEVGLSNGIDDVRAELEIKLGKGVMPETKDAYNALEIKKHLESK